MYEVSLTVTSNLTQKETYMAWRDVFATEKVKQKCSKTIHDALRSYSSYRSFKTNQQENICMVYMVYPQIITKGQNTHY